MSRIAAKTANQSIRTRFHTASKLSRHPFVVAFQGPQKPRCLNLETRSTSVRITLPLASYHIRRRCSCREANWLRPPDFGLPWSLNRMRIALALWQQCAVVSHLTEVYTVLSIVPNNATLVAILTLLSKRVMMVRFQQN